MTGASVTLSESWCPGGAVRHRHLRKPSHGRVDAGNGDANLNADAVDGSPHAASVKLGLGRTVVV